MEPKRTESLTTQEREKIFLAAEQNRLERRGFTVVTVSGSNGKSTVKEMLVRILEGRRGFHFSPANLNTKTALARQLLSLPADARLFLAEVGARHRGDLHRAFRFLRPDVAALLNIGHAHVAEFGGVEPLVREKLSVLSHPSPRFFVIPGDDPRPRRELQSQNRHAFTFGESLDDAIRLLKAEAREQGWALVYQSPLGVDEIFLHGLHRRLPANALAAIGLAVALGASREEIREGLQKWAPLPGRFSLRTLPDGRLVIEDAFNSSPESLQEGLQSLKEIRRDRPCHLILGSMLELGDAAAAHHRRAGEWIRENLPDASVDLVGEETKALQAGLGPAPSRWFPDVTAWLRDGAPFLPQVPLIYTKSSKSVGLKDIPWDDLFLAPSKS
ncbi:MAG: UDP-N-acetylmuramoyl-tripeptide--D-alanyl-D-alanine ligase [Bdellovibrionaceae bacterium]|nr:UDP-N-acetylmuramoyl-tripeptide--D-alanyl-D-alanine ligase [Pseudobdellovibrionaceae bacterium]